MRVESIWISLIKMYGVMSFAACQGLGPAICGVAWGSLHYKCTLREFMRHCGSQGNIRTKVHGIIM